MIESIALVVIAVALVALIAWIDYNNRKERSKLLNMIAAKTPEQLRDLEFVDKVQPPKLDNKPSDIVPLDQLDEEEFDDFIKAEQERLNG